MATAFADDGSVDLDGHRARSPRHLVDNGHDGVVVVRHDRRVADDHRRRGRADPGRGQGRRRRPRDVVAGVGTNATAPLRRAGPAGGEGRRRRTAAGHALLQQAQPGRRPRTTSARSSRPPASRDALRRARPYRHPDRARDLREAIAWEPVVAVKDAVGDFVRGVKLIEMGYAVYSGDDVANLGWLAHGAVGFVSVVGHAAGKELAAMADAFARRRPRRGAAPMFTRLVPAIDAVMGVPNYGATTAKAALQLLGVLDNRNVRAPLVPLDDTEVAALREVSPRPASSTTQTRNPLESPPPRTLRAGRSAEGGSAGHPARRSRRDRSQHDRLRVRQPSPGRRLRGAVPRGSPPRRRPDPSRLRADQGPPRP